jgi:hypothetical protein
LKDPFKRFFRYGFSLVENEEKIAKKLCGFLFWKNYQVVFYFGKNFKWFFILEKILSGF